MCLDIKNYFLATHIQYPEHIQVKVKYILDDIKNRYDMNKIITNNGQVYIKIKKGILRLR